MKQENLPAGSASLEGARQNLRAGRILEAAKKYRDLLDECPNHPEALNFLAMDMLRLGDFSSGVALLEQAYETHPNEPLTLKNLAIAYVGAGRLNEAEKALAKALKFAPDFLAARLELGKIFEKTGRLHEAARLYFSAIRMAQAKGKWLSEATTPIGLRQIVPHVVRMVNEYRRDLFRQSLKPLQELVGRTHTNRVEQALGIYLGELKPNYEHSRQRPKFLYVPGLFPKPYLPRNLFPWLEHLEAQTKYLQAELSELMSDGSGGEPFLQFPAGANIRNYLQNEFGEATWDAFFFYRHGRRYEDNLNRCPTTAALLEALPLTRIKDHAPEVCFSVLTAGTHIMPHYGVTNTRVVVHLPLIVPADCVLNVGGELHHWQEGECVVFDDTFEHEAWNRSRDTRVVLILDIWNPYLTSEERVAITDLVMRIGEFNEEYLFD